MSAYTVTIKFFNASTGESYTEDFDVEAESEDGARWEAEGEAYEGIDYGFEASAIEVF